MSSYCKNEAKLSLSYFQHVNDGVSVRYLVISPACVLVILISQLSSVGVRLTITHNREAGDYDLLAMDNLWTARNRGCGRVFLSL